MITKQEAMSGGMGMEHGAGKVLGKIDAGIRRGVVSFTFTRNELPTMEQHIVYLNLTHAGWTATFTDFTDYPDSDYTSRGAGVESVKVVVS